jgi:nitrate reductase gamma subunit
LNFIDRWLELPLPALWLYLAGFYGTSAIVLIFLSFSRLTGGWVQSFRGVVAPYFSGIVVIFGILVGFLANDIWDRSRRAAATVRSEAVNLTSLHDLITTSGLPALPVDQAIHNYVLMVVEKEWPAMARGEAAPEAESAQDKLLEAVADLEAEPKSSPAITRVMLDTALKIRDARYERLLVSADFSESFKWMSVLVIALTGQISCAVVHLERARPQIAAMVIFTTGVVIVLGLIASHEFPFSSALAVSPEPIAYVLKIVPNDRDQGVAPSIPPE